MDVEFCDQGYSKTAMPRSKSKQSIIGDLEKYKFDDEIKKKADEIFCEMGCPVKRKRLRLQLLFYCTYYAHARCGRKVGFQDIGEIFGLDPKEINRTNSIFSEHRNGFTPPDINSVPQDYIPDLCQRLQFSPETINDVLEHAAYCLEVCPDLYEKKPRSAAIGIITHFIQQNGIPIANSRLAEAGKITFVTIDTLVDMIKREENMD